MKEKSIFSYLRSFLCGASLIFAFLFGIFTSPVAKAKVLDKTEYPAVASFAYTASDTYTKAKVNDLSNYRLAVASYRAVNDKALNKVLNNTVLIANYIVIDSPCLTGRYLSYKFKPKIIALNLVTYNNHKHHSRYRYHYANPSVNSYSELQI
jgi:hypothetical protein